MSYIGGTNAQNIMISETFTSSETMFFMSGSTSHSTLPLVEHFSKLVSLPLIFLGSNPTTNSLQLFTSIDSITTSHLFGCLQSLDCYSYYWTRLVEWTTGLIQRLNLTTNQVFWGLFA